MRTTYVIYNRIEISTCKCECKITIAPEKASLKHRGFSRGNLLKHFFVFFVYFFECGRYISFLHFMPELTVSVSRVWNLNCHCMKNRKIEALLFET